MAELAEREVASWPRGEPIALHPRLQRLTLEIILRAVFGLERGAQLDELRELLTKVLAFAESPLSMLPRPPRLLASRGPVARQDRLLARTDELIFELIEERRREGGEGDDVLALLLGAKHEDGSPMSPQELRDELMTALVAGHETTASQLAWGFERLAREPAVQERLREELDGGLRRGVPDGDDPGDPAPQAGTAPRRAAHGQAAGGDRRRSPTRPGCRWWRTSICSTTTPRSTPILTRSARSGSSSAWVGGHPAPTRGFPSAAAGGAVWARASRCLR